MITPPNLLFICSKNEWRSKTAETIFQKATTFKVKSAGTSKTARIRVQQKLIDWSDVIFVMEDKHKQILKTQFNVTGKELIVLGIPDEYKYMNEELIAELQDAVAYYLEEQK